MRPDNRSPERIRHHYEVEKELASRLRNASQAERMELYSKVYEELWQKVPDHPMLVRKQGVREKAVRVENQLVLLKQHLKSELVFLEIGPGDCSLSFELCRRVAFVYGVDISETITQQTAIPSNFKLILSDGVHMELPDDQIDFAYSNQLMEHLHPDDALMQLREIYRVLKKGGKYLCVTPHRFMGPDDVSQHFDDVATCFHLKEYTNTELHQLFKSIGFTRIQFLFGWKNSNYRPVSIVPSKILEGFLNPFPHRLRKKLSFAPFVRNLMYIKLLATK